MHVFEHRAPTTVQCQYRIEPSSRHSPGPFWGQSRAPTTGLVRGLFVMGALSLPGRDVGC